MTLLSDFLRVTRSRPCPICGRIKYCLVDRSGGDDPSRVICTKTESSKRWGEAGWLHVLRDEPWRRPQSHIRRLCVHRADGLGDLARRWSDAVTPADVSRLAAGLGLTAESLSRLGLGWANRRELRRHGTVCAGRGCWTFPMRDAAGAVTGVRLRTDDGFKYAVAGSHQGLFVPGDLTAAGALLIAEGPTDTAALLDAGFQAVGRPSCSTGSRLLAALVLRLRPQKVVIVSDADLPGLRGANALANDLRAYLKDVRVVRPPSGVKDARAWAVASRERTADEIGLAIGAAPEQRLTLCTRERGL